MGKAVLVVAACRRGDHGEGRGYRRGCSPRRGVLFVGSVSRTRRDGPREACVLGYLLRLRKRVPFSPEFFWRDPRKPVHPEVFVAKTRKTRTTLLRSKIHP